MKARSFFTTLLILSVFLEWHKVVIAQTNFLWAKQLGGTGNDQSSCITLDASGNIYTAGTFSGTADFDPGPDVYLLTQSGGGTNDVFVCKLDDSGNFVWAKQFPGNGYSDVVSISVDSSGNVYTAGVFNGTVDFDPGVGITGFSIYGDPWDQDIFISKLDNSGNYLWADHYGTTNIDQLGGMITDPAGNVYATGNFSLTEDFDPGAAIFNLSPFGGDYDNDIFILKLDASGNFAWVKHQGGIDYEFSDAITLDKMGNIYTTGGFNGTTDFDPGAGIDTLTSLGDLNIFISKLDTSGNLLWANRMGGLGNERGSQLVVSSNGDIYSAGSFSDTSDFDPGPGVYTLVPHGTDNEDIYISKLHSSGVFEWAMPFGGTGRDVITGITTDASGSIYMTGSFENIADFDPRDGVYNLMATGGMYDQDDFFCKLDANGFLAWADGTGSDNYDQSNGIVMNASGDVIAAGQFGGTTDFNPGPGIYNLVAFGEDSTVDDAFVLKLHNSNVGIAEHASALTDAEFNIYPNPNTGIFNLAFNLKMEKEVNIDITDVTGRLIKSIVLTTPTAGTNSIRIDEAELSNGIYFVRIYNKTINRTMKMIIDK